MSCIKRKQTNHALPTCPGCRLVPELGWCRGLLTNASLSHAFLCLFLPVPLSLESIKSFKQKNKQTNKHTTPHSDQVGFIPEMKGHFSIRKPM